jgi:hypothetical protein
MMKKLYFFLFIIAIFSSSNIFSMAAPANDDCGGAVSLTVNPDNLCGTTSPGTVEDATASAQNATTCFGTEDDDVWYSFVATNTTHYVSILNAAGSTTDMYHSVWEGPCATGMTLVAGTCSDPDAQTLTGLTIGNTYFVRVYTWTGITGQTSTFDVCIGTPPPPPANDDCGGAISLTVNPDNLCGNTTTGSVSSATPSPQASGGCFGTDDDDVWYSFVATDPSHNISLLNVAGSTTDMYHSVWEGTCPGLTLVAGSCSDGNTQTLTGLTVGNTYFIRVYTYTSTTGQTSTYDVCVGTDPPPLTITGCTGTFYDTGGAGGAYASSEDYTVSYCSGVAGQCVSLDFTSFSTESCCDNLTIYDGPNTSSPLIGTYAGTTLNGQTVQASNGCLTFVWHSDGSVTNPGWAANVSCSPCPTCTDGILNGQEVGVDCGGPTCPACPCSSLPVTNDEACCATPVTVNPDQLCGSTTSGTVNNATPSFNANSCFGTDDDDVWYSFVATQSNHSISLLNIAGSTTDMYFAVFGGTCSATGTALLCSDANTNDVTGLTPGNTYFIRVYTWTSTGAQNSTFDVCVGTPPPVGPCGNPTSNDFCSNPGTLTQGTGTWTNTTVGIYTADNPANISIFCGSIENNSWYVFTAQSTTETFTFSGVGGTACGSGIQAEVYSVTTDANGCCTNFTSVSNCFNPASQVGGTVTATPLVVGQDYYLMIDGNAGAGCDFSVSGWDVSLPVELLKFQGYNYKAGNRLIWTTATEINNDYFIVQKSTDGKTFIDLGMVDGSGNSNTAVNYSFIDESSSKGVNFYRLKQIDFDGEHAFSKILIVESKEALTVKIYPNPTVENFLFDISDSYDETYTVKYIDITGSIHIERINISEGTNTYEVNDFKDLAKGIYFVQILDENNEVIKSQKVVKK